MWPRGFIEEMEMPHESASPDEVLTLRLGVATAEDMELDSPEKLVKHAEMALCQAKERVAIEFGPKTRFPLIIVYTSI